jgi:hypothetical protein
VSQSIVWAHAISGLLAAVAGMMVVARLQIGQPTIGDDWLILSFAAPVIGGALLQGGHVSVAGTFLGVVIVAIITQALVLFQIDPFIVQIVLGRPYPLGGRHQPAARDWPQQGGPGRSMSEHSMAAEAQRATRSRRAASPRPFRASRRSRTCRSV